MGPLAWLGVTDAALQAQVTAALVTAMAGFLGVLITGIVAILTWRGNKRHEAEMAARRRKLQRDDVQIALRAEIDAVQTQWAAAGPIGEMIREAEGTFERAARAGEDYTPYVTAETGVTIFDALRDQIAILDPPVIKPVVRFYRQVTLIERFAGDLRDASYAALAPARKKDMLVHYLRMIDEARALATDALVALDTSLGNETAKGDPDAAQ